MSKESRARLREARIALDWKDLYRVRVEAHEQEMVTQAEIFAQKLRDPNFAQSLGLPAQLPDSTIEILKRTMAMDKVGPRRPKVDHYCDPLGNPPSVLHRYE